MPRRWRIRRNTSDEIQKPPRLRGADEDAARLGYTRKFVKPMIVNILRQMRKDAIGDNVRYAVVGQRQRPHWLDQLKLSLYPRFAALRQDHRIDVHADQAVRRQ